VVLPVAAAQSTSHLAISASILLMLQPRRIASAMDLAENRAKLPLF
jgi:hypothetical protein